MVSGMLNLEDLYFFDRSREWKEKDKVKLVFLRFPSPISLNQSSVRNYLKIKECFDQFIKRYIISFKRKRRRFREYSIS